MPDVVFRIRTEGDIGRFLSTIQNDAQSFVSRTNKNMEQVFKSRYGGIFSGGYGNSGIGFGKFTKDATAIGPAVKSARLEFDQLNNTMRVVGETGIRIKDQFISTGNVAFNTGNLKDYEAALRKVADAQVNVNTAKQAGRNLITQAEQGLSATESRISKRVSKPFDANIIDITKAIGAESGFRSSLAETIRTLRVQGRQIPNELRTLASQSKIRMRELTTALSSEDIARDAAIQQALGVSPAMRSAERGVVAARASAKTAVEEAVAQRRAAGLEARNALVSQPEIPANVMATLRTSNQLKDMLLKAGLGQGAAFDTNPASAFAKTMQTSTFNAPYMDLVKGTTRVSGEFVKTLKDGTPQLVRFGAEIDRNGKVLTRFGGNLSGVSNFLRMIQRDFVKVIEWTVATTVVFASMGAAINTIKQINEVDKLLQRFAITAQMTAENTREYFSSLARVAYETATPLNEMVKVADDLALATKKSGQTTQDWTRQITEMSNAVGILTNIAGIDTASATEQLTSMMKQMGVQTNELVGILNKITAVAGGQQQAVADITKGLAVMAQAGEQAGLSLNQQIGTIQTLSQVTSKSSSEVATAFKNLVGSIDSAGSIKILKEFGIEVRDQQGNARNFLDIYKEIADAFSSGLIPAGRQKEVIKGIAGGPRRAPDAAAMIANVNAILDVTEIAANAANEALLANAKILDTNSAKLVQLKVKLDQLAFEKFATIIRDSVGDLTDVLKGVLGIVEMIPNGFIQWGIQVTAFLAIIKVVSMVSKGIAALFGSFAGLIGAATAQVGALRVALGGTAQAAAATAEAMAAANGLVLPGHKPIPRQPKPSGIGLGGRLRGMSGYGGSFATLGAGALLGAGMSAASGGDIFESIGGGLSGLGMTALVAPLPLPHVKLLGAAALALGTALQFVGGQAKNTKEELTANTEAVLNAATAYTNAQQTIENFEKEQKSLIEQIGSLKGKTDVDSINAQIDAQNKLAEVTANLAGANNELYQSFQNLNTALANSGEYDSISDDWIIAARNGTLAADQVEKLRKELELLYLQKAYPDQYIPKESNFTIREPLPTTGGTVGTYTEESRVVGSGKGARRVPNMEKSIDAATLSVETFKSLFQGDKFMADMPKNLQTSIALYKLVAEVGKTNADEADRFTKALENAGIYMSNLSGGLLGYQQLMAQLNTDFTLGLITGDEKDAAAKQYQAMLAASTRMGSIDYSTTDKYIGYGNISEKSKDASVLEKIRQNPSKVFIPGTQDYRDLLNYITKLNPALKAMNSETQANTLQKMGFNIRYTGMQAKDAAEYMAQYADQLDEVDAAAQNSTDTFANLSASLYNQYLTGEITKEQWERMSGNLRNVTDAATGAWAALQERPDFQINAAESDSWNAMIAMLVKIPGFENAATMKTSELIAKIQEYGSNQNATNAQAKRWGDLLVWIKGVIDALPKDKIVNVRFHTYYTSSGTPMYTVIDGKKKKGGPAQPTVKSPPEVSQKDVPWTGGSSSGGGGGGSKPSVGSLDIPKEFLQGEHSVSWYVSQAVAWAKKYQSKVPGENTAHRNDLVAIMNGNNRVLLKRGISEEYLRKAMEQLTEQIKKQNDLLGKADTIRRIRIGAGDFAALANVPMNAKSGISVGGPGQPINVNLNINGQVMTPAQFTQLANAIAAQIKKSYQNS